MVALTASSADSFEVRLVSQTNSTITLGWDPQPGYGYLFSVDGQLVSRTNDASRSSVKFSKGASSYEVAVVAKGATGTYPPAAPPPPPPPPALSGPQNLRATSTSQTSITLAWDAVANATNYRVFRDGTLLGQGPGSSGGFANEWTDGGRTCGTTYVYGVDAQDAAGNTSTRSNASLATAACSASPACSDGVDNDSDGKVDLADPGCSSSADTDETDPVSPPPGSTMTGAQFESACNVAGAVIDSVSVTATVSVSCAAQNVTVRNSRISGVVVNIEPGATGFHFDNTDIADGGFNIWGADNVTIENGAFDGAGNESSNQMWDKPAGNGPQHIVIRGNSFSNYRGATCDTHGEALFIGGYSNDVLVDGNTFSQNGCTSHIFFSYFGNDALSGYRSAQVPRNVCVRGNTFGSRYLQTYFDVNFRSEVAAVGPAATGIKVQPGSVTTNPEFDAVC